MHACKPLAVRAQTNQGMTFSSDTDTEVIPKLCKYVYDHLQSPLPFSEVRPAVRRKDRRGNPQTTKSHTRNMDCVCVGVRVPVAAGLQVPGPPAQPAVLMSLGATARTRRAIVG
jgi:hypothetical protein